MELVPAVTDKLPEPELPASIELGQERLAVILLARVISEMVVENEIVFEGSIISLETATGFDIVFA
jgi:hypothetical protein